jgi:hypothetical protein
VRRNWEAGLWFDETTSTLLAGDLLSHAGQCPALTESDCVAPALEAESIFHATGLTTDLGPTLEQLAELNPTTLAIMHGSSYSGDGAAQLRTLADGYAATAATGWRPDQPAHQAPASSVPTTSAVRRSSPIRQCATASRRSKVLT